MSFLSYFFQAIVSETTLKLRQKIEKTKKRQFKTALEELLVIISDSNRIRVYNI